MKHWHCSTLSAPPKPKGFSRACPETPTPAALASILAARGEHTRAMTMTREIQSDGVSTITFITAWEPPSPSSVMPLRPSAGSNGRRPPDSLAAPGSKDPLLAPVREESGYQKIQADLERRVAEFRAIHSRT